MPVALVHDYLLVMRGAERTFAAMAELWPEAPIYTLLYDEEGTQGRFAGRTIITSPLQRLGASQRNFRVLLPLLGPAVRAFDLGDADVVISSSSAFAHAVRVPPGAQHICYCHSPFRYAWLGEQPIAIPPPLRPWLELEMRRHRNADRRALPGIDHFIANSRLTSQRIDRFWRRDSTIIHPPVEVQRFHFDAPEDYVLYVGEVIRHKRVDLAIMAAAAAGRPIKIVGAGPELASLQGRFRASAEFLGRVSDAELAELCARAAALVVPGVEEFGIAAVEAQAAGRPVVAFDAGGVQETVIPGETGVLVPRGDAQALARALCMDFSVFDPVAIRAHALSFSPDVFADRMAREISARVSDPALISAV